MVVVEVHGMSLNISKLAQLLLKGENKKFYNKSDIDILQFGQHFEVQLTHFYMSNTSICRSMFVS